ncbi:50S ribosomal protein L10 [Candidatus Micrarchaeota archaeon RBG_16_49_10]|nr:MAG: 50S ribosomal protein L10 [Candidatus Micrarchaeota archaeon RBG_16_49_10]
MVSARKIKDLENLKGMLSQYHVISLIDLYKLPSSQLHAMKKDLRKDATIRMSKKRVIDLAFKDAGKKDLEKIMEHDAKEPALIFTNINPFKLFRLIERNKSTAFAKEGDIMTKDIVIPEGPTKLMAGPAIGDLQRAKIPAKVQDGKIHVIRETKVAKKGDALSAQTADLLKKLDIQVGEIGIYLVSAWEDGIIFERSVLNVDQQAYLKNLMAAAAQGMNLAVNIAYPTKQSIELLLTKAHQEAKSLGMEAGILEKEIIGDLLAKGQAQARALKEKVKLE